MTMTQNQENTNRGQNRLPEIQQRALKAGQAAIFCGISRRYLHDLTKQGRIPYHRIGARCFVYNISDLNRFLDSCKIG